ncbi:protein kinase [Sorangium cellulosum]|uniref:Protein kinase n=1 Tax=Sorangium cellulosum TaxID=56 RepID=A0A2L0ENP9_SORCE|nr:TOMM system kinase/cyclase fusion protein [Sorangium cellulosum]AUX40927.1 protein kinase [Sorangium cellulosum]
MSAEHAAADAAFLSRYELVSLLAKDRSAELYKARQRATGQLVAVRMMPVDGAGRREDLARRRGARLRRSVRLCARLHHPNIVRLIDAGQTEQGQLYTVFELVPGQNLSELLADEGALGPQEARHLMLQVLDALGCAHGLGVVHGEMCPAAVVVVPTGARRNALVIGFCSGVVAAGVREDGEAAPGSGERPLGAPVYAAPEQLRGFPPTARSDLYSWALVFLECLTGKPAVTRRSLASGALEQASAGAIRIPAALRDHPLGALLRRATQADIAARSVTADGLLRELDACSVDGLSRGALTHPDDAPAGEGRAETGRPTARAGARGSAAATPEAPGGLARGSAAATPEASGELARGSAATTLEAPATRAIEAERRPLTAVCCALTLAGPGLAAVDVDEVDELFGELLELCDEVARRHGGRLECALGDQVLLHFGYPAAHEDDARRGARAALEIAAEIRARSARLEAERGISVALRAGIHTGLVVAREGQQHVQHLGVTLQTAARLSAAAAPGAVVVSGETHQILRGVFDCEETRACVGLEGTGAARVYRLNDELPAPDRTGSGEDMAPLFGRELEIDLLIQRWGQARQGTGQSVLVTGGPGIGKSRLALELVRRLRREAHACLECRCSSDRRKSALHPIVDLLERLVGIGPDERSRDNLDALEALLSRYHFRLEETVPLLAALLSIPLSDRYTPAADPPLRQRRQTFETLLSLVFEMAEERPMLLLVEDLHWADAATLEWLGALVGEVPSARVLALLVARPEFAPPWATSGMLQIQLGRLDRAHVQRMVEQIAGGRALPAAVLEQIVRRADGVPLHVEELTRMVLESGTLREEAGRYVLSAPLSEIAIPTSLRALLAARLDRLGRAKETAQIAAVLGREFTCELLAAVSQGGESAVREDLDVLIAADLIHGKPRASGTLYTFKHVLLRDAAYESLPRRAQRWVHARVARALEESFPEIVEARPELLARHWAAAGQKPKAIGYAERAAERALNWPGGIDQDAEAVAHIKDALGWLAAIPDERERAYAELRLSNLLIQALLDSRGHMDSELMAAVGRCQELNDMLGDTPLTSPTLWAMCAYHHQRNHRPEARQLAERLVNMAERSGDTGQLVWSLPLLGHCAWIEGKLREARQHLERAVALYDDEAHRRHAFLYGMDSRALAEATLVLVLCLLGYPKEAIALGERVVAWARELDHPPSLWQASIFLIMARHFGRDREKVAEESRRLEEQTKRKKFRYSEYCATFRCWAAGDLDGLLQTEPLRSREFLLGRTYYLSLAAELEAERGQHEAAIERLDRGLRLAEETGEVYYVPELCRLKAASVLAYAPRAPEGEACLQRAIAVARTQGARLLETRATVALCRVLLAQGRRDEGRTLLGEICGSPDEPATMPELIEARRLLGELSGGG